MAMSNFEQVNRFNNREGKDLNIRGRVGIKMKKIVKSVFSAVCLGMAVLTLVPAASWAAPAGCDVINSANRITPMYLYIVDWDNSLTISGTTATVDCWVKGKIGSATKAKVIAELQEKNGSSWTTVRSWTATSNSYKAEVFETATVSRGKTYRVKATVTVWEGSPSDSQIVYSPENNA